jgi:methylmalonyl-CoA/ethylmalonyl-CoA epimerase
MESQRLGTNVICQVGLIVSDIEKSIEAYSQVFNLPIPEVAITDPAEVANTKYKGNPTDARAKLAFFDMGQVSLELIEPVGGPSTWRDFLEEHGEGVHHIAFRIKGTEQVVAFLKGKGIDVVQQGNYTGGMYTYLDSEPVLGTILELLENFDKGG